MAANRHPGGAPLWMKMATARQPRTLAPGRANTLDAIFVQDRIGVGDEPCERLPSRLKRPPAQIGTRRGARGRRR